MKARVLTGSKQEIAEKVADLDVEVREAIVFFDEPPAKGEHVDELFSEMEPFTVRAGNVDYSRESLYGRTDDE